MGAQSKEQLVFLYDFAVEDELIAQMQEVSLDSSSPYGLSPNPLVGSKDWWDEIETGRRPLHWIDGVIDSVWWGSMADYPEFSIRVGDGTVTTWTREGDGRRYVEGIRARLSYVQHSWKDPEQSGLGDTTHVVLQIWLEDTPRRSSGIAPGPGGVGYQLAREHGNLVHYLGFSSRDEAERAIRSFSSDETSRSRPYSAGPGGPWFVQVWDADTSGVDARCRELAAVAEALGGQYDGGEIVEGRVWGPRGVQAN